MRQYELVVIFRADLEEKENDLLKQLTDLLSKEDVKVASSSLWGKKQLAYKIEKQSTGLYAYIEFKSKKGISKAFTQKLKHNESIIRYLLIRRQ